MKTTKYRINISVAYISYFRIRFQVLSVLKFNATRHSVRKFYHLVYFSFYASVYLGLFGILVHRIFIGRHVYVWQSERKTTIFGRSLYEENRKHEEIFMIYVQYSLYFRYDVCFEYYKFNNIIL